MTFEDYHDRRIPEPSWLAGPPDWYEDMAPDHCGNCGAFLPAKAERTEPWEDGLDCNGAETIVQTEYTEGLIAILGEEFRDQTYPVRYSQCGIEVGKHEPHREVFAAGVIEYRTCRKCGTVKESSY